MKANVLNVTDVVFPDGTKMNKLTLMTSEGICEMYTQRSYLPGEDVELIIKVNNKFKPIVKIA